MMTEKTIWAGIKYFLIVFALGYISIVLGGLTEKGGDVFFWEPLSYGRVVLAFLGFGTLVVIAILKDSSGLRRPRIYGCFAALIVLGAFVCLEHLHYQATYRCLMNIVNERGVADSNGTHMIPITTDELDACPWF
jgi:hypothetical protein